MATLATFAGRCGACGDQIEEGDPIVPDEDYGWVHEDCADEEDGLGGSMWGR